MVLKIIPTGVGFPIYKGVEYINEAIKASERSESKSDDAVSTSTSANQTANTALNNSESTQNQLDTVIIESGTSDAEVLQARGPYNVLNDRLNVFAETKEALDFQINRPLLRSGEIILPSDFPYIGFRVKRLKKYHYTHNQTPHTVHDWSNATELFISGTGDSGYGDDPYNPINLGYFELNYNDGVYGTQKDFIFTFLDNLYANFGAYNGIPGVNILFRSGSHSGETWVGRVKRPTIELEE